MVRSYDFLANSRYLKFVKMWKQCCMRAQWEFAQEGNESIWALQRETHKPCLETWWCGCLSFAGSAYHICKHLVRLYIGEANLQSNKPPMPFYGEIWRQSSTPVLWVAGVHDPSLLTVHDLRRQVATLNPPILTERPVDVEPDAPRNPAFDIEPAQYSTDDEDEDYEDDESEKSDGERNEDNGSVDENDWDEWLEDTLEDDAECALDEFAQREFEGEQIVAGVDAFCAAIMRVHEALIDAKSYALTHPRLKEIPRLTAENMPAVMRWADNWHALRRAKDMPATWSRLRRRNMFL